ncbi:hypothetical protein C8Q76DRAFT_602314, partial [Earliella scabrosa]
MRIDGSVRLLTTIDAETGSILLRHLHPRIANYNDLVIFLMKSNMDIKHIGSGEGAKALIYYITDYITKSSLPTHLGLAALMYAITRAGEKYKGVQEWSSKEDSGALTMLINSMLARQEVSHPQIMSYLVGGGDHYTSHRFRVLHYGAFDRQNSESEEEVQQFSADGENISGEVATDEDTITLTLGAGSISAVSQQQDYAFRPRSAVFDSMCLYEFVGLTEKIALISEEARLNNRQAPTVNDRLRGRPAQERGRFLEQHPQSSTHILRRRVVWTVPVILGDKIPRRDRSDDEREQWARAVLILFRPWRVPSDIRSEQETWLESYTRQEHLIPRDHRTFIDNINVLSECKDARDRVNQTRQAESNREAEQSDDEDESVRERMSPHPNDSLQGASMHADEMGMDDEKDVLRTLDSLISLPSRVALDRCFQKRECISTANTYGEASIVQENERSTLDHEHRLMKQLKRKRTSKSTTSDRPRTRQRRGNHDPVIEVTAVSNSSGSGEPNDAASNERADDLLPGLVHDVITEFALHSNEEQCRAFEIVARHVCYGGRQLLMYVGGIGGTGKSHVVNAVLTLFQRMGR